MYKTFCDVCGNECDDKPLAKEKPTIDEEIILNGKQSHRLKIQVFVSGVGGAPATHLCGTCLSRLMGMFDNRPKDANG